MENALSIALSNQVAIRRHVDVVANNMANASTPGFKGENMMFAEHLTETRDGQKLSFVEDVGTAVNFEQGTLTRTDNPFDMGIQGKGWFVVRTPEGDLYTRNGHFRIDSDRQLVNSGGHPVLTKDGQKIVLGENDDTITVKADGTVKAASGTWQLQIAAFDSDHSLFKIGGGLFRADSAPKEAENFQVIQGVSEASNVKPILEVSQMIWMLRQYQSTQKFIETEQELQRKTIQKMTETQ